MHSLYEPYEQVRKCVERQRQYSRPIPGARPTGKFANAPIRNDEIAAIPAVACKESTDYQFNCRCVRNTAPKDIQ